MRNRFLLPALTLLAVLPTLAPAQAMTMPAEREGSWEFSVGAGALYIDGHLATFLGSKGFPDSGSNVGRLMPTAVGRLGYNISNSLGFSIGAGGAIGSGVKYVSPFVDITYTADLNAGTSPFLTGGAQFTRITGNKRVTHPTWGARAGIGIRHMLSENLALRVEARMAFERYEEMSGRTATYSPALTLGISYFTEGRRAPVAMAPPPCPVCARARVDTVWRTVPPPPPPPPHKCALGVAPQGFKTDEFGCLMLQDTLLLQGVHFDFDKSDITPAAAPILDRVAESMLNYPYVYFEIAGHTDSVGTFAYNYLLSARRARAVRDYLIQRGVPASRMTAVGYGEGFPIAPNATVAGRALNRRGIEIRVKKP